MPDAAQESDSTVTTDLADLLNRVMADGSLIRAVLSDPRDPRPGGLGRVTVRQVSIKGRRAYQLASRIGNKETHENAASQVALERILTLLSEHFRQAVLQTDKADYHVRRARGRGWRVTGCPSAKPAGPIDHDRRKQYVLPPDRPVDFLVRLGLMAADGRVIAARWDKFRQINRFLEMVADVAGALPRERPVTVVDFGCGKGYLTFALFHYLKEVARLEASVIGVDVKPDMVESCGLVARELSCEGLGFRVGDIRGFDGVDSADMVVALHACDTATDDALARAVQWGARVILAAPCCQHELYGQIEAKPLTGLLKHGIIRERFAALATDSLRAAALEACGYAVQILEFADTEHTPKNLLLRAVKRTGPNPPGRLADYASLRDFLHASPSVDTLIARCAAESERGPG